MPFGMSSRKSITRRVASSVMARSTAHGAALRDRPGSETANSFFSSASNEEAFAATSTPAGTAMTAVVRTGMALSF
jgi:hypothetical protein